VPGPSLRDYVQLFALYDGLPQVYLEPDDNRYTLLFEQAMRLLARPSEFNDRIPLPFRVSARNYLAGEPQTLRHLGYPENRHFLLSDLYDFVMLQRGIAERKGAGGKA
jgi:hypothetical protein